MSWIVDDDGRRVEHNNDTCATCAFYEAQGDAVRVVVNGLGQVVRHYVETGQ